MDWLRWSSTVAFLAVAGYCVRRLVAAARAPAEYRGCHRATDLAHVLMGVGMAVMASPVGGPLPMPAWQTVFLLMTAWFVGTWWQQRGTTGWRGGWHGNGLHHAVAAAAMLYMLTAMSHTGHNSSPWLSGDWTAGMALPLVGWALVGYFLASAAALLLTARVRSPEGLPAVLTRGTTACQLTMALGTSTMIAAML